MAIRQTPLNNLINGNSMKNIGVLTYHCIPNFGAQLQALSTIGYLRKHGYNPIMLHWYPKDLEEFYYKRAPREQNELQMKFAESRMPISKLCRSIEELCKEIQRLNIEAIFLGSDALFDYTPSFFRYNYSIRKLKRIPIFVTSNHRLPNPFWGSFNDILNPPIPFVGFSISSQNMPYKNLNKEEKRELKRLLLRFKGLTVRDKWTRKLVKYTSKQDVKITPDPVFAFNQNTDYHISKEFICNKYQLPENYILISFLYPLLPDEFVNKVIELVEKETGAECVSFPMPDKLRKFNTKHTIELPLNPIDWYFLIKYSRGYIGERMHPIVVALHNSIPFFCFDQYGAKVVIIPRLWSVFKPKSSKIYDILEKAGFLDNMCFYPQINKLKPKDVVDKFLSFDKEKCSNFSNQMQNNYNIGMDTVLKLL